MEPQLAQCRLTEVSLEPGKDWHWSWWAEEPLACVLEKAYCPSQTEQQKLIQSLGLGNRLWDIRAPLHSSLELNTYCTNGGAPQASTARPPSSKCPGAMRQSAASLCLLCPSSQSPPRASALRPLKRELQFQYPMEISLNLCKDVAEIVESL